jgi:NAD(P)-dependent dehydrogenase (short-subunit alcohol dehydrogenase family)
MAKRDEISVRAPSARQLWACGLWLAILKGSFAGESVPNQHRIAVVTGANRGLGLETCRQLATIGYRVVLTSRDRAKGAAAAGKLRAQGLDVHHSALDVTDPASVTALTGHLQSAFGRVDALVNNAGILSPEDERRNALTVDNQVVRETLETNTIGALRMCQALLPLMREHNYGRVVNVSSMLGQISSMGGGWPAYRISKVALNAVTRIVAAEVAGSNILVNSACPGWVRTDMGGRGAPRSVEEGADTIVWLATLPDGGPSGGFFQDRRAIDW